MSCETLIKKLINAYHNLKNNKITTKKAYDVIDVGLNNFPKSPDIDMDLDECNRICCYYCRKDALNVLNVMIADAEDSDY